MALARPKEKIERRLGERLFLKASRSASSKAAIARKPYPPGMHGKRTRRSRSDFAAVIREKQKIRWTYGLDDTKLKHYFSEARAARGRSTIDTLVELLERRLDNVVFRLGFAPSRSVARHLVSYGHVTVNGASVTRPSYRTRPGDTVALKPAHLASPLFHELDIRLKKYSPPEWLILNREEKSGVVERMPRLEDAAPPQNIALVVDYYSH